MRLLPALALVTLTGCFLRPSVRRVDPDYRSQEAYGSAHWGMTEAEVASVVPDLTPCGDGRLCREELLKERPARVTYELQDDRLVRVHLRVDSADPRADFEKLREELTNEYGPRAQLSSARIRVGGLAVVAMMDAVGSRYKPILGPMSPTEEGWTTPETEMRLESGEPPNGWLELTLSSRLLVKPKLTLEGP